MPTREFDAFIDAICSDKAVAGRMLSVSPALIDLRDGVGETPLHYLAIENCVAEVDWLIARGADVNCRTHSAATPLMHAATLGYEGMVDLLLRRGADVDQQDNLSETAFFKAASRGRLAVCGRLLAGGANPLLHDGIFIVVDVVPGEVRSRLVELLARHGFDEADLRRALAAE